MYLWHIYSIALALIRSVNDETMLNLRRNGSGLLYDAHNDQNDFNENGTQCRSRSKIHTSLKCDVTMMLTLVAVSSGPARLAGALVAVDLVCTLSIHARARLALVNIWRNSRVRKIKLYRFFKIRIF